MAEKGYKTIPFPPSRQIVIDAGRLGIRRHIVHGLLEVDVTRPRQFIREHKTKTGERLSFTGFIITCLAQAIQAYPLMHAYRKWRNQLVLFKDVDVVTMIETEIDGVALPHIIRAANRKAFYDIHHEIRAIQAEPKRSAQKTGVARFGQYAPRVIRDLFYWGLRQNPHWMKKYAGTVVVTAVGMFGQGTGWGFGFLPMHTLGLTLGGIAQRPALIDGQLSLCEYLCVTISVDHDIVDGAPATRFAQQFRELVVNGYSLWDKQ